MAASAKVSVINALGVQQRAAAAIRVRAPTLLLVGDQEQLYEPQAMLQLAQRRMPGLEGEIVADADHIAAMAQPDAVNARIIEFLEEEPRP